MFCVWIMKFLLLLCNKIALNGSQSNPQVHENSLSCLFQFDILIRLSIFNYCISISNYLRKFLKINTYIFQIIMNN